MGASEVLCRLYQRRINEFDTGNYAGWKAFRGASGSHLDGEGATSLKFLVVECRESLSSSSWTSLAPPRSISTCAMSVTASASADKAYSGILSIRNRSLALTFHPVLGWTSTSEVLDANVTAFICNNLQLYGGERISERCVPTTTD